MEYSFVKADRKPISDMEFVKVSNVAAVRLIAAMHFDLNEDRRELKVKYNGKAIDLNREMDKLGYRPAA